MTARRALPVAVIAIAVAAILVGQFATASHSAASFDYSPESPEPGEQVTFTARTSTDRSEQHASYAWDLDNDGTFDDATGTTAQRTFAQAGSHVVRLRRRVTIPGTPAHDSITSKAVGVSAPPAAAFDYAPLSPQPGQQVTFTSTTPDPPTGFTKQEAWDLDDDGAFDDATGPTAQRTFPQGGSHTVRLRVRFVFDGRTHSEDVGVESVGVSAPPDASFTYSPTSPEPGQQVTFTSTTSDPPAGFTKQEAWDLANDGAFDDATGPTAQRTFPQAASYTVRLRVRFVFNGRTHSEDVAIESVAVVPAISVSDVSVTEGDSGKLDANFAVSLSGPSSSTVTVQASTLDDSATAPSDYSPRTGTLSFAPGTTSQLFTVQVEGDVLDEADDGFKVTLSQPAGATVSDGTGRGTIVDDDPVPSASADGVSVGEGQGAAKFTVSLAAPSGREVTVDYGTFDGSASATTDYQPLSGVVSFAPGEQAKVVEVPVVDDTLDEPDETFAMRLPSATNAEVAHDGTGTIVDNDAPAGTVIDFDDLASGTVVESQYANRGVVFGFTPTDPSGKVPVLPVVAAVPAVASSKPNVVHTPGCRLTACSDTIHARFTHTHQTMSVLAGGGGQVRLAALDRDGNAIPGGTVVKQTAGPATTKLEVKAPDRRIAFFSVGPNGGSGPQSGRVLLDDLAFDPADPARKPDFGLAHKPLPGGKLAVARGGSATTQVVVNRIDGANGPIRFTVTGALPDGVTTNLPMELPASGAELALKVTASPSADDFDGPLTLRAQPLNSTAGSEARGIVIPIKVGFGKYNLFASGIEVTQAVQAQHESYYEGAILSPERCQHAMSLPGRDLGNLAAPVQYGPPMVRQVAGQHTVVRAFASVTTPLPLGRKIADVPAVLHGSRGGTQLPGSPLSPQNGPRDLAYSEHRHVTCADRADPARAYTFMLPPDWTQGTIDLRLELLPTSKGRSAASECPGCQADNALRLKGVPFEPNGHVRLTPIALKYKVSLSSVNVTRFPPFPGTAFARTRSVTPSRLTFANGGAARSYAAVMDITADRETYRNDHRALCRAILDRVTDWVANNPHGDLTVGVYDSTKSVCPGVAWRAGLGANNAAAVSGATRSLTSVAHETFHLFGRLHADPSFGGCGGSNGGSAEQAWPPDRRGEIHGIGLDRLAGVAGQDAPYRILIPGELLPAGRLKNAQAPRFYDFMSYCVEDLRNPEVDSWISDRGWNETFADLRAYQTSIGRRLKRTTSATPAATTGALRVSGSFSEGRALITTVKPSSADPVPPQPASPYRVVVRGPDNRVTSEHGMLTSTSHIDGEQPVPVTFFRADVPVGGAARVDVVKDGAVLATRRRSRNAPTVAVLSPRRGARVGQGRNVTVRWRGKDADGDPLQAAIDYSTDDGRTWVTKFTGPNQGKVALPSTLFAGSARARVRVRINDGFNETFAVSKRFTAVGGPPRVSILSPVRGQRGMNDAPLYLEGEAFDDAGREISRRRISWFSGRERIGRGLRTSAVGLPAGKRTIRLEARDAKGRVGKATVRVRLKAAAPQFLVLKAPKRLSRRAGRIKLRVASTVPATLAVSGNRRAVGRRARRIVVPITPGRKPLSLVLRLKAGGRTTRAVLRVPRA